MKLSELIKSYRIKHNLSLRTFAEKTICSFQYINNIEKDEVKNPSIPTLKSIAKAMDMTLDDLFKKTEDFQVDFSNSDSLTEIPIDSLVFDDYFPLPYYSGLSAGSFEELLEAEPDSLVYVPIIFQGRKKHLHAFKVNGTSMNNVIPDGSIVVSEDNYNNAIRYTDGTIVVAFMDGTATVKRLYSGEDNITLSPDSTDKSHMPIIVPKDKELVIIGKVIWHRNPEDIAEKWYWWEYTKK